MKKLIVILLASYLAISQSIFAVEEAKETAEFDPYFSFEVGLSVYDNADFKVSGITFGSEGGIALSPAIGYQMTNDWGILLQESGYSSQSRTRRNRDISPAPLLNVRYRLKLYTLTSSYNISVSNWLDLKLNAGVVIGDDAEEVRECIEFSQTLDCNTWSPYDVNQQTKLSAIAGTSLVFNFSENWGLKLGYQYSPYRNGLTKTDLMIKYNFR